MKAKGTPKALGNGEVTAGPAASLLEWKPYLNLYPEKQLLRFANKEDLHAAIELLWTEPFRSLPHCTADGRSIVVPKAAVEPLARAGLKFTATPLRSISDLSAAQIRKLRR